MSGQRQNCSDGAVPGVCVLCGEHFVGHRGQPRCKLCDSDYKRRRAIESGFRAGWDAAVEAMERATNAQQLSRALEKHRTGK